METSTSDTIDLQELTVRIIRYFRNHLVFILVFVIAGIGLGVFAFNSLPNVYESRMVVYSDILTQTYGDRIDRTLNGLIKEDNYTELSARLGLSQEKVAALESINIDSELDVKSPQREKVEKDETYFIITAHLTDRSILPELQEGLLNYLRNNDFVKARARQREATQRATINQIDRDLRSIDSLKRMLFKKNPVRGEDLQFDPATLYATSVELMQLRGESQQELDMSTGIQLVEGFTAFQRPKDPKLSTMIMVGFLVGLFLAISILTLRHLLALSRN